MQQMLLNQEETKLFEDFLLHEIAEAIRSAIFEAEEWVQQINKVLSGLPMIGEHYALQWKPQTEYDLNKPGSHLAQHYRLLRKPTQALTAEETETLMNAFRQEIDAVRLRQQEHADMNFLDALEQVFDYREWFHFDVLVSQPGGQRHGPMHDVIVANGQWHGGGMRLAPEAKFDDGLFDVVLIGNISKLDFVTTSPKLYKGGHVHHPRVDVIRTPWLEVEAAEPLPVELEGEPVGTTPSDRNRRKQGRPLPRELFRAFRLRRSRSRPFWNPRTRA